MILYNILIVGYLSTQLEKMSAWLLIRPSIVPDLCQVAYKMVANDSKISRIYFYFHQNEYDRLQYKRYRSRKNRAWILRMLLVITTISMSTFDLSKVYKILKRI